MCDLESTSTLGMWELDEAKKEDDPRHHHITTERKKKSRNRFQITIPGWIIDSRQVSTCNCKGFVALCKKLECAQRKKRKPHSLI